MTSVRRPILYRICFRSRRSLFMFIFLFFVPLVLGPGFCPQHFCMWKDLFLMHVSGFLQQRQKLKFEKCNFEIAVIFYPVIKTLWTFLCISFGYISTQILNLGARNNVAKMLKIVQKSGKIGTNPKFTWFSDNF